MKLLIATNNPGKIKELERLLNLPGLELVSAEQAGLSADFDVEETGRTFEENAVLKAEGYASASRMWALADDSGVAVDALGGEPGVYSKRYAGLEASDTDRIRFLLEKLQSVPDDQLQAQFVAVVALAGPDGKVVETQPGICEGRITRHARGTNGFGYDPIFEINGQNGRTMAELSSLEKDTVSHRGQAVASIRPTLLRLVEQHQL